MTFTVRWSVLRSAAKDIWPLGLAVLGLFGAFVVAAAIGWLSSTTLGVVVQTAGIILSLLGILTTVVGLIQLRSRFKGPIRGSISSWFGLVMRAFKEPRNFTLEAEAGSYSVAGVTANLTGVAARMNPTVEQRVSALEQDVSELRAEMKSSTSALRDTISMLTRDLQQERRERQDGDRRALQEVEELAAGGFDLAMVGVFWTIAGTVLASPVGEWAGRLLAR